jgi:hypothetical protein
MDLIFRHFPLVAIAVVLVNAAIARARIPQLIATGGADAIEAERFVWFTAAWLIASFAVDETLVVSSGASSALCFMPVSHPTGTWQYLAWTLWIGWVLSVTVWVWIGRGAERVAKFGPLFAKQFKAGHSYKMSTVRLITLVWCVGTIAIPLLMPADRSSTLTCP